jgi:hypothetical protein
MQIQQQILSIPGAYQAAKASVGQNYENLTGDVLASGKNWMQDLYGRMADPNANPNAALVAQDPALTAYAQQMSGIDETADLNQATDQAWFDKMQQNSTSMYQNMLAQLAAQAAAPVTGGGGGGGGGRGRRGGGGYGGGGGGSGKGVNNWKVPTTTVTNEQQGVDKDEFQDTGNFPGFFDDLMAQTEFDPEMQALAELAWQQSEQSPRNLTQNISKAKAEAIAQEDEYNAQAQMHQDWKRGTPLLTQTAIAKLLTNNPGARLGDDPVTTDRTETWFNRPGYHQGDNPATKDVKERYWIDPGASNTPPVPIQQGDPVKAEENSLAEELLGQRSHYGARQLTNKIFGKNIGFDARPGVASPERLMEEQTKGAISPGQIKILATRGAADLARAKGAIPGQPFDIKLWGEGGGFIPDVDPEKKRQREKNMAMYNYILDAILPWNQNANVAPTREQHTSTDTDKATYSSKTTNNKDWWVANPGSPVDLTPSIPNAGLSSNPLTNPQGYSEQTTPPEEFEPGFTEDVSDFGGVGLSRAIGMSGKPKGTRPKAEVPSYDRPTVGRAAKDRIRTTSTSRDREPTSTKAPLQLQLAPGAHARRNKYVPKKDRVTPALNITKNIFGKPKKKAAAKSPKGNPRYR